MYRAIGIVSLGFFAFACGGNSAPHDIASAVIGPSGGTVTTPGGASVTVPAGAVSTSTTFTVTASTSTLPSSIGTAVGPVYRFGPSGATFSQPVMMTLPFSDSRIPAGVDKFRNLAVFTAPDGTTSYTTLGRASVNGNIASAQTVHFSECVVGVVNCAPPCSLAGDATCVCPSLDGGTFDGGTFDGGTFDGGVADGGGCTGGSCTTPEGDGCVELGFTSPEIQSSCTSDGNVYSTSPCSRTGSVGGCQQGSGVGCNATWYYSSNGTTAEQVQAICSQTGATYVAP